MLAPRLCVDIVILTQVINAAGKLAESGSGQYDSAHGSAASAWQPADQYRAFEAQQRPLQYTSGTGVQRCVNGATGIFKAGVQMFSTP
jgi:hypothetical protein